MDESDPSLLILVIDGMRCTIRAPEPEEPEYPVGPHVVLAWMNSDDAFIGHA